MDNVLRDFLNAPVQLKQLLRKLDFADEDVARAASENPSLYLSAGRFRVKKMRERMTALHRLEIAQAEAGLSLRKVRDAQGKKKYTESQIKERIVLDEAVRLKRRRLDRGYEEEELAKILLDSYRYRKDALRIIVDGNYSEGVSELRGAKEDMVRADMKKMGDRVRNKFKRRRYREDEE
jgi:hypothetical protein